MTGQFHPCPELNHTVETEVALAQQADVSRIFYAGPGPSPSHPCPVHVPIQNHHMNQGQQSRLIGQSTIPKRPSGHGLPHSTHRQGRSCPGPGEVSSLQAIIILLGGMTEMEVQRPSLTRLLSSRKLSLLQGRANKAIKL